MADYTPQTWTDDDGSGTVGTSFTKARMDTIEAGVQDAAQHHKYDTYANRPAAAAGNKNWLYTVTDDVHMPTWRSSGSAWQLIAWERRSKGLLVRDRSQGALAAHTRSGNVLTASANGSLNSTTAFNSAGLLVGDLVLVKDNGAENGVYVVTTLGAAGAAWVLTRYSFMDATTKMRTGMSVIVSNGIANARDREIWQLDTGIQTTPSPVLNTDTLTFTHRGLFVPQDNAAPYQDYILDLMVDINGGVLWPLKFDPLPPTSLYQWIALSQPSQFAETLADEGVASTTYVNPTTAGPTITLPLPGEYRPQMGARSWHSSGQYGYMSFDWSGSGRSTANMDDDAHKWMGGVANMANTGSRKRPQRVLPGNIAITAKYRTESGGNVGFAARWMEFNAVRVGTR